MAMSSQRQKILVVADDRSVRLFLKVNLTQLEYDVIIAKNTAQGIVLAKCQKPAIVICECKQNINDALNFCHILRTEMGLQATSIIFLAPDCHPERIIAAYRHGVDAVLKRTVSIRMLVVCIETLACRAEQISASAVQKNTARSNSRLNIAGGCFSGSLDFLPLIELIQFLHYSKKSGNLLLTGQGVSGRIVMETGEAIYAQSDNIYGEKAVHKMACWQKGAFTFDEKIITSRRNISKSTMKLVLECCTGVNGAEPQLNHIPTLA